MNRSALGANEKLLNTAFKKGSHDVDNGVTGEKHAILLTHRNLYLLFLFY